MPPSKDIHNPFAGPGIWTLLPPRSLWLTSILGDYYTKTLHSDTYEAINSSNANFHGKNVFICGASKGIGRSISLSFAKAGASCIAIGARSDQVALEKDIKVRTFRATFSYSGQMNESYKTCCGSKKLLHSSQLCHDLGEESVLIPNSM